MFTNYQQHFTPEQIAKRLYDGFELNALSVVDFSAGAGNLLAPALKRWPNADTYAIEIDHTLQSRLTKALPASKIIIGSAYSSDTLRKSKLRKESVDLVVGNPPFQKELITDYLWEIIAPIYDSPRKERLTIPAVFLHLCLAHKYLREDGFASFIVPKNFLHGLTYQHLRSQLEHEFAVLSVESLAETTFSNADVKTYHVLLQKKRNTKLDFGKALRLRQSETNHRRTATTLELKISDFSPSIVRGKLSSRHGRQGLAVHTSHLPVEPGPITIKKLKNSFTSEKPLSYAKKNDILISRVGSRSLGRLALVKAGTAPITDCVLRLRFENLTEIEIHRVFARMKEADIRGQALNLSTGSCAAYLTVDQLLSITI